MAELLIVDDEKGYREVLSTVFAAEGYGVATAPHGRAALSHLKKHPADLILSDVRMPDMDGIELLKRARAIDPDIGIVLMTAFGTIGTAREAFKLGADDFIQKPFNNEELKLILRRTLERRQLVAENRVLKAAQRRTGSLADMIGSSAPMARLKQMIETIAPEHSTVLISGDSGTGKELVARAIHGLSPRAGKPFVPVNCGALSETLLESELFGHVKGAFTGAEQSRPGVFEAASGGTIFLDEVGEMSPAMQVRVLRVLQEGRLVRVGSASEIEVDVRVIAATNRDLGPMVAEGTFRKDLFYRISVIPLAVPPLGERREDIAELAEHFVRRFSARSAKTVSLSAEAAEVLNSRPWPGNVRELEHAIERAVALTPDGGEIAAADCRPAANGFLTLPAELPPDGLHLPSHIAAIEKALVEEALRRTGGNRTRAAELLQIPFHAYRHLLAKHGL